MSLSILLSSTWPQGWPKCLKTTSFRYWLHKNPSNCPSIHVLDIEFLNWACLMKLPTFECLGHLGTQVTTPPGPVHLFSPEVEKLALHSEQSVGAFPPPGGTAAGCWMAVLEDSFGCMYCQKWTVHTKMTKFHRPIGTPSIIDLSRSLSHLLTRIYEDKSVAQLNDACLSIPTNDC